MGQDSARRKLGAESSSRKAQDDLPSLVPGGSTGWGYDLVLDGSDSFTTRYAVFDACFFERGRWRSPRSAAMRRCGAR
jgi:hypothetical protein